MSPARSRRVIRSLAAVAGLCIGCSADRLGNGVDRTQRGDGASVVAPAVPAQAPSMPPTADAVAPLALQPRAFAPGPDRPPVAAGSFYPSSPDALGAEVRRWLDGAEEVALPGPLIAIVTPHAGYGYSGPTAGWAFRQIRGTGAEAAVVVGGHVRVARAAVYARGSYSTPLGAILVDDRLASAVAAAGDALRADAAPHLARDHALEVVLPFLQVAAPGLPIVPVYFNTDDYELARRVGRAIATGCRGRRVLLVCSTDLSHYPDAATASASDRAMLEAIASLDIERIVAEDARLLGAHGADGLSCTVCGLGGVIATIEAARQMGAVGARVLRYEHSGDRPGGDADRVVGYGAVAVYGGANMKPTGGADDGATKAERMLTDDERARLLKLARDSIQTALDGAPPPAVGDPTPALARPSAAFVTLHERGQLRGCIGTFDRSKPLWQVVAEFARHAAFQDSRFRPVGAGELAGISIEISVLSPLRRLENPLDIRLGIDGIWIVGADGERGTFLPQVATETGWSKETFLSNCAAHKAGLAPDAWRDPARATVHAYTAEVFGEK